MNLARTAVAAAIGAAFSASVLAQGVAGADERDAKQQQRIEQGLKSGQLTTQEAAKLERGQARINRMEANALKDGTVTPQERARIERAQDAQSRAIHREKHDAQTGNPNSPSSLRMQADVQRNANQERRIAQGERSGQLTTGEAARLERGQARVDRAEARAGADGHVGKVEEARVQAAENRQSARIRRQKHDAQTN